jgi:methylase of polypeptide subunit release factors
MEIDQAVELIGTPLIDWTRPQSWCDLGSGTGTFTMALARLMAPGSTIFAVDQDRRALAKIPNHFDGIEIRKIVGDLACPADGTGVPFVPGGHSRSSGSILHPVLDARL